MFLLLVDIAARTNVYEESDENHDPDWTIECGDAHDIPSRANPAPQCCVSVEPATLRGRYEDISQGDDERDSVTENQINDVHFAQPLSVKLVIKGQVDVECHGQGPECVRRHEPVSIYSISMSRTVATIVWIGSPLTHIWMRKAWNWQPAEFSSPMKALAMRVATFVMRFPKDA